VGPAGSGKSTLTGAFYEYLYDKYNELNIITLNLDPGVKFLPYTPHVDIRDFITLEEVMSKYSLGPNGGLIVSTDLIVEYIEDLKFEISEYNDPDIVIIDTPGQMELFAFRSTGPLIANSLGYGGIKKATLFLFDPNLCKNPNGFISTLLLATSVQYRFLDVPQINVLSKIDLVEKSIIKKIIRWSNDYNLLENETHRTERGLIREMSSLIAQVFMQLGGSPSLINVSATTNYGMDNLWGCIQRILNYDESPLY